MPMDDAHPPPVQMQAFRAAKSAFGHVLGAFCDSPTNAERYRWLNDEGRRQAPRDV
jgi:hypothetical protein